MKKKPQVQKNKLLNFFLLLASAFLTLLIIEVALRLLPQDITKIDYSLVKDERIYSSTRTMKFKPNFTRVWTGLGPPTVWHFNNLGYRERAVTIDKPENIFRIVVIGDSIVMGFGVEDFEAFPRRLEQLLKPKVVNPGMIHFEVINLGVQGYASPEYLAVLKEDALRMKPNLAIVAMYPSNDLSGTVIFKENKFYNSLMSIPDFIPLEINEFLKRNYRLYLFTLTKYYTFIQRYQPNFIPPKESTEEEWSLMESDVQDMEEVSDGGNAKLVLLAIPKPREVAEAQFSADHDRLLKIAEELEVSHYGFFDGLKKYKNVRDLYLNDFDDHFSPKGNEYFATLLADFLWDNDLVPKQPESKN